jgi:hypothetical protein
MAKGCASSLSVVPPRLRRARIARRVGSARAYNVLLKVSIYTLWFIYYLV